MPTDSVYWLKLHFAPKLGPTGCRALLQHFDSAQAICEAGSSQLQSLGLNPATIAALHNPIITDDIKRALEWSEATGQYLLTFTDADYPQHLKDIHNPPAVLYVRGNPALLSDPQLAIVGSRNPSHGGLETAEAFAKHLANTGLIITSGLALGIDAAAHKGALAANQATIAVTATGADRIYPARHRHLAESILEHGAIITEFPLGTSPRPELFPQRNRIISGLSLGTLVIEAAQRSGSLITARHALEQAREVFAIPGSIHNPLARGCHQLIRQGAKLVESANDILEELAPQLSIAVQQTADDNKPIEPQTLDTEYQTLLNFVGYDPISVDQLVKSSGFPAQSVSSMLLILELEGHVNVDNGGLYVRRH